MSIKIVRDQKKKSASVDVRKVDVRLIELTLK